MTKKETKGIEDIEKQKVEVDFTESTAKERVEAEIKDLKAKGEKIQLFVRSEKFKALPYASQRLLSEQFNIIASYIDCLTARLSIWSD